MSDKDIGELIKSGLEYLVVSLDGTTQEVYSKYRIGGSLDKVLQNLTNIINKKKSLKSKRPFIEWQFLVMKQNCHQIDYAKRMAKEIGVDLIRFIPVGLPFDARDKKKLAREWYPYIPGDNNGEDYIEERFLQKAIKGGCFYLYRSVTINPGGEVAPCCAVWKDKDNFGNMLEEDFSGIWNNRFFQNARALFSKKKEPSAKTVCSRCNMFYKNGA
jgi:radical SAM protein with 4Fe4S-binding SPASM domain